MDGGFCAKSELDSRSFRERAYTRLSLWTRLALTNLVTIPCVGESTPEIPMTPGNWGDESDSLLVCFHGMGGFGPVWDVFRRDVEQNLPKTAMLFKTLEGSTSISRLVYTQEVAQYIVSWSSSHPEKPVCLIGFSAGAPVAMAVDYELGACRTPVTVVCAAGLLWGTRWFNVSSYVPFSADNSFLTAGNAKLSEQLEITRAVKLDGRTRQYFFYASPDDIWVIPWNGALPKIGTREQHHILPGYDHDGVLGHVLALAASDKSPFFIFE